MLIAVLYVGYSRCVLIAVRWLQSACVVVLCVGYSRCVLIGALCVGYSQRVLIAVECWLQSVCVDFCALQLVGSSQDCHSVPSLSTTAGTQPSGSLK